jgi:hypothetical protein
LSVDGAAIAFTGVTDISGSSIQLRNHGSVSLPNVIAIDVAQFDISGGSKLVLPLPTSYDGGANGFVFSTSWNVSGAGSELSFPNLTTWIGRSGLSASLDVSVTDGGLLSMPLVTSMPARTINLTVSGTGSKVELPELTTFQATGAIFLGTSGELVVPKLAVFQNHGLSVDGSAIAFDGVTDISGSSIQLRNHGSVSLPNVVAIDVAQFDISGGSKLVLPLPTSYDGGANGFVFSTSWNVSGAGSELSFPNLTTWIGRSGLSASMNVAVTDGGLLSMPLLTSMPLRTINLTISGTDSKVELPELTSVQGTGTFSVGATSTLIIPKLQDLQNHTLSTDGATVVLTSTLTLGPQSVLQGQDGTISGNVLNQAMVQPGAPVGLLTITGNYTQTNSGTLAIEIGGAAVGSEYDQLQVNGTATLDGTLALSLVNGFDPAVGSTFVVMQYGSVSGNYTLITGQDIGNGKMLVPTYNATNLTLTVANALQVAPSAANTGLSASAETISSDVLQTFASLAIDRFAKAAQLDEATIRELHQLQFVVTNLPGNTLGATANHTLWIDQDAAGFGWFVDPTPGTDEEFDLNSGEVSDGGAASGHMDLLTVLAHELGHVLGFEHNPEPGHLMSETLAIGTRLLPIGIDADIDNVFTNDVLGNH